METLNENQMTNHERKIEGYQRLFKVAYTTYIENVAKHNNCSVEQIVKISNTS